MGKYEKLCPRCLVCPFGSLLPGKLVSLVLSAFTVGGERLLIVTKGVTRENFQSFRNELRKQGFAPVFIG
jgi:hypothetical protein